MQILLSFLFLFLLTACPSEKEVQEITYDLKVKKSAALEIMSSGDFTNEKLLIVQDYFFSFGEKVHLLNVDKKSREGVAQMISKVGIASFCSHFVMPLNAWNKLESSCRATRYYRCSPDIESYLVVRRQMLELLGPEIAHKFAAEASCH